MSADGTEVTAAMKPEIRNQEDVQALPRGLEEIRKIMMDGEISEGAVSGIGEICEKLLKRFYFDDVEGEEN